ncbi:tail fiber domain-containing protein [Flammeovirga yaeyamensis]|uniref:Tail fiber domain-containing protein n=1 Tax=Flammeovirga yaeyamensis TaxID=367791 RepID=A0AAX1NC22_9BACT|nr:tail fiber domain-containing protein [Flammeovirga yaeyamensis]MBB3696945.1 hypothetical protein [Flammeovirga yaeyamensis]NMF33608.1 hypothetical protein [Flammeovirga yaeyamensis]QWG05124.1 tail fiber domain-containing protein [Flammeovirga yaeyamensis]
MLNNKLLGFLFICLMVFEVKAQTVEYSGQIIEKGKKVNGQRDFYFAIGSIWSEEHKDVNIDDGKFHINLGEENPLYEHFFDANNEAKLYVSVNGIALELITIKLPKAKSIKKTYKRPLLANSTDNRLQMFSEDGLQKVDLKVNANNHGQLYLYDSLGKRKAWLAPFGVEGKTGGLLSLYGDHGGWVGTGFKVWEEKSLPFFHLEGYKMKNTPLVAMETYEYQEESNPVEFGVGHFLNSDNIQNSRIEAYGFWHTSKNGTVAGINTKDWDNNFPQIHLNATDYFDNSQLFTAEIITHKDVEMGNLYMKNGTEEKTVVINPQNFYINDTENGYNTFINSSSFKVGKNDYGKLGELNIVKGNNGGEFAQLILRSESGGELKLDHYSDFSLIDSDIRYKRDIQPLSSSLEKVMQLNGVSYHYRVNDFPKKSFSSERQIGVIAQEVEKVYPELVVEDNKGMKSVHYAQTVAVLIEAIKELNQKVEALEEQNETLKAELQQSMENKEELETLKLQLQVIQKLITDTK